MQITNILGKENCAILLHPNDDIAIARGPLARGQEVVAAGRHVILCDPVPAGHKLALREISAGEIVKRYGEAIGRASRAIRPGAHVHSHNLSFEEPTFNYEFPAVPLPTSAPPVSAPTFMGYQRPDGRAGTRNYIAVVAASNCAAHTVAQVERCFETKALPPNVDGVVAFPHGHGCGGLFGRDEELLLRTISGVMEHPNVFAALIVGLGCELNHVDRYLGSAAPAASRVAGLTLQTSGGTSATVDEARRQIALWMEQASAEQRVQVSASKLVLGLNCGGSDSFSGITANPALGVCSNLVAAAGGAAVLAETPEIFGAEHLLVKRAASREVAERLLGFIAGYKTYASIFGGTLDDNRAYGNKEGGLTSIVEKSLGAVTKGGDSPLRDAVDYAERIRSSGLVFMNTPGYDPVSLTGLAAGGVNLIAFTTGRGSAIGFPTIPVVKIASNSGIFRGMRENMDINAGGVADGERTIEEVGAEIFDKVLRVASGERTASERLGHKEFVPWRCGPVL